MRVTTLTRLLAGLAALSVAALGLFMLAAWRFDFWRSTRVETDLVPMAPSTAFFFSLLGLSLAARIRWPESRLTGIVQNLAAVVVLFAGTVVLTQSWSSIPLPWDAWVPVGAGSEVSFPIGRMSPLSAFGFFLSCLALLVEGSRFATRAPVRWLGWMSSAACLLFGLAVSIGYATDMPLFYGADTIPVALLTGLAFTALNTGILLHHLREEIQYGWDTRATRSPFPAANPNYRRQAILAATLVSGIIIVFWVFSLRHERTEVREHVHTQLAAIANLKVEGIVVWRAERLGEAHFLQRTPAVARDVLALISQPRDPAARLHLLGWLEPIKGGLRYESVLVVDPQGNFVFSLPEATGTASPVPPAALARALARREVVFTDFHRTATADSSHLELLVPIVAAPLPENPADPPATATPIAVIVLRLDPRHYLFPFVHRWPVPSRTGVSFLVAPSDDAAGVLHDPRYPSAAPAGTERGPVALALRSATGDALDNLSVREGIDERDIPVLATTRRIPGSNWTLITKIDRTEAYAPIWRNVWWTNASVAFLLLAVVLAAANVVRRRDATLLRLALAADRERDQVVARLALVTRFANDIILFMDENGRILEANDRALDTYGYTLDELRALPAGGLRSTTTADLVEQQFKLFRSSEGAIFETVHRRKDGTEFPVEVSGRTMAFEGRHHVLGIYRDISERKRLDRQIASQEARFRFLFEHAQVGISLASSEDGCELVNQEHARISGVSIADSREPDAFKKASHPEDYARQVAAAEKFLRGETDHYSVVKRYLHPGGAVVWAQLTTRRFVDPETKHGLAVTTLIDITERLAYEAKIEQLNRRYLAISQVNQALVQRTAPAELFNEVCRVLVEIGRFKTAWIGLQDAETGQVNPCAVVGDELGFMSDIRITSDASAPEGRGWPGGKALRENRTFVCNDFIPEPATLSWREEALRCGIRSVVALPLRRNGAPTGLLLAYGDTVGAFGSQEIRLLEETARDVSFGLAVFAADDSRRESEASLRVSESRLQFLLSATPAVIYALRATGDFGTIFISRNVREVLGYEPEAFTAEPEFWRARLHPADAPTIDIDFTVAPADGTIGRDYRFRHRDGSYRWMHDEMRLVRDSAGRPLEFVGYWFDITERKVAEEKLAKMSSIIERAPLSIIITDLTGVIEYANPRFCAVTGYSLEEVKGRNPRLLKSGETPPEVYAALWQTITRGETWSGELRNRKKNGDVFLETVVIAPMTDESGRVTHYVALKDDVTAQRRFLAETTAMLAKEREVSELKSRFISVTSHEFRTPMAVAMGSVEILVNHYERLTAAKRQELFGRITRSFHRMTEMLDDVLTMNRLDAKRAEVRPVAVDFGQFAKNLIEEIRIGDDDSHRFDLQIQGESGAFFTDPTLLHHLLSNLLRNAVRYSAAGTDITVRLQVDSRQAQVSVVDQGMGIPPDDLARIFEPFERGSNVGNLKGTGLGLNIVRRMADLLGGTIDVESTVGRGSRFTLTLPPLDPSSPPP